MMRKASRICAFGVLSLLLWSNGALALVDISGKDKVEVGSWGELKNAVADSANAGKVIVLKDNITADMDNPIDMVGGAGIIIDGGGHTIIGQEGSKNGQFINFDSSDKTDLIIQNVNFEGFSNVQSGSADARGGVIYNRGYYGSQVSLDDIIGDFEGNYAKSENASADGGAIYNSSSSTIGDIKGDFSGNYAQAETNAQGGAIYNGGTIGDIIGDFTNNFSQSDTSASPGGAILNVGNIGNIIGDFISNHTLSVSSNAQGGAIDSHLFISSIIGNFTNNYAQASSSAYGGAISNYGTIGDITGDFSGNYAQAGTYAQGGAVYNMFSMLTFINSSFIDNYVETAASKDSSDGKKTQGGAIYTEADLTIKADGGESIFKGNNVKWADGEESSAIYLGKNSGNKLYLDSKNDGLIQFDDKIKAYAEDVKNILSSKYNGAIITEDGEGGYFVEKDGEKMHYQKKGAFYEYSEYKTETKETLNVTSDAVKNTITQIENKNFDIKQEGDNYTVIGKQDGTPMMMEMMKQADGSYNVTTSAVYSQEEMDELLASLNGATVKDDGNGGYIVEMGSDSIHISKTENGFAVPMEQQTGVSSEEVQTQIEKIKEQSYDIVQEGDNYTVTNEQKGKKYVLQFIKQKDGTYTVIETMSGNVTDSFTDLASTMIIAGDSSSRVVFNNAIENVAKIDISGTNVDANEGVGTIFRTITHDGGVLNINAGAKAEDSIVNQGGTMNVANSAKAYRTEVNNGGVLNVANGGFAQDTTVNTGGKLTAASQATINNMLANDGAILDIDRDAYLTGNIIIHAAATMGGSYDYSQIFKDEVTDQGSLTLVGGLNATLQENSLVNNVEAKKLNLTAGDYAIGDGTQSVEGWDVLTVKDNATVKLEGDIAMSDAKKKLYIENGSTLDLAGHSPSSYTITGSLVNDGLVTFSHVDDEADDTTTVYGNYIAYNNAQMTIDVNPQTNTSDLMIVDGDVQGTTLVNLNVLNEAKPSEKILFVEALNDNPATGAAFYTQDGHIFGSPYKWNVLYENNRWYVGTDDVIPDGATNGYGDSDLGEITDDTVLEEDAVLPPSFPDVPSSSTGDAGNGNTSVVFRKPSVVGEVIAYMGLPSAGIEQTRDMTRNVSSKVASTKIYSPICHGYYDCEYNGQGLRNAWASPVYSYSEVKSPYKYDAEIAGLDAGLDLQADAHNRLGVFVSSRYGNYDFDGKGDDYYSKTGSEIDIDSYILGLYYRYDGGKYWAMSQVFGGYQDVDIASDDGFGSTTDGIVFGGSFESGLTFTPRKDVVIEPTMRVGYTQINYDKLKDNYGKTADFDDVRNIELEAGVKIEKAFARDRGFGKVYIKPSVIQNIGSGDVNVTGLQTVEGLEDATLGRVEVGGSMSFNDNWSAYLFAAYTFGSDYKNASINAGLNYAF